MLESFNVIIVPSSYNDVILFFATFYLKCSADQSLRIVDHF